MSSQTLPSYDLQALADTLIAVLEGAQDQFVQWTRAQQLLMDGRPVSPEQLAAHLHITRDEVPTLFRGAEFDAEGNLVGVGLSVVPTPHSYVVNGRQLYVWCAADAIIFPILHRASAVIQSQDPISGEKIRLIGTPEGAKDVEPSTVVVSWVPGTTSFEHVRTNFCNLTNFFASAETASQYVARHPGLVIVPVDAVFQIGKLLWEREPFKSVMAELEQHQA